MDIKILFFIAINFYSINSNPYDLNRLMKREKFCGERLWRVVSLACQGNYNGPDKRIYNDIFSYGEYDDAEEAAFDDSNLIFPFLQKESVRSLIPRKFRKSDGIVNECCYKSCSREHLKLYCKPRD